MFWFEIQIGAELRYDYWTPDAAWRKSDYLATCCASEDNICPQTSKEDIIADHADHFNDEQPQPRNITIEQCRGE